MYSLFNRISNDLNINKLSIDGHTILFKEIALKNTEDTRKICENFMYLFDISL